MFLGLKASEENDSSSKYRSEKKTKKNRNWSFRNGKISSTKRSNLNLDKKKRNKV